VRSICWAPDEASVEHQSQRNAADRNGVTWIPFSPDRHDAGQPDPESVSKHTIGVSGGDAHTTPVIMETSPPAADC